MQQNKVVLRAVALVVFAIALTNYLLTMAPTLSFWDCGEFAATAHILGNPHPPGNPLYLLIGRTFILTMRFFSDEILRMNFLSAISGALTVMMCFLFTEKLVRNVLKEKATDFLCIVPAIIGAFLVCFSDSFWFSAVETETYLTSMFGVMCVSYLALIWYENRGTPKGTRSLLGLVYISFLTMGIVHFGVITVPAVMVFLLMADKDMRTNIPAIVTGVLLLSIVYSIGNFLMLALVALSFNIVAWLLAPADSKFKGQAAFASTMVIMALLGASTYLYVPIRSNVNPAINEGEPGNWKDFKDYIERKQYGSESMIERALLNRRGAIFHQVVLHPHMGFGGYMLAQYFPWKNGYKRAEENSPNKVITGQNFNTLWEQFGQNSNAPKRFLISMLFLVFQLPIAWGLSKVWAREKSLAAYAGLLYIITTYGMITYMNFADGSGMELRDKQYWAEQGYDPAKKPEPVHMEVRDRDYFWTPGFMFMGILFGIASAMLLAAMAERMRRSGQGGGLVKGTGIALATLSLAVPSWSNYNSHNRSDDYVPWDYAYNLLMSCRPNSILYTNGDNDTFPLWFMQQVEEIRKDVRVVNLSLVNTNWYIKQLSDGHNMWDNKPFWESVEENHLKRLSQLGGWKFEKARSNELVMGFSDQQADDMQPQAWQYKEPVKTKMPNSNIVAEIKPLPYLKVQDIMVMHLAQNNYPKRPVHFAVTVGDENMMGLDQHLIMEGMVYTLVEEKKNKDIIVPVTAYMVDSVYKFRGLGEPNTHLDVNTEGLLTNYSATNSRLIQWAQEEVVRIDSELRALKAANASSDTLAKLQALRKERRDFGEKYLLFNQKILTREWRNHYWGAQFYSAVGEKLKAEEYFRKGELNSPQPRIFTMNLAQSFVERGDYKSAESLMSAHIKSNSADFEMVYGLSEMYNRQGKTEMAKKFLTDWVLKNPTHEYAPMIHQQLQSMDQQLKAAANAAVAAMAKDTGKIPKK